MVLTVPTRKRQHETNHVQIEIGKREGTLGEEKHKKKSASRTQEDSTKGEYAYFKLA